jgi:hypothetical protein
MKNTEAKRKIQKQEKYGSEMERKEKFAKQEEDNICAIFFA